MILLIPSMPLRNINPCVISTLYCLQNNSILWCAEKYKGTKGCLEGIQQPGQFDFFSTLSFQLFTMQLLQLSQCNCFFFPLWVFICLQCNCYNCHNAFFSLCVFNCFQCNCYNCHNAIVLSTMCFKLFTMFAMQGQ